MNEIITTTAYGAKNQFSPLLESLSADVSRRDHSQSLFELLRVRFFEPESQSFSFRGSASLEPEPPVRSEQSSGAHDNTVAARPYVRPRHRVQGDTSAHRKLFISLISLFLLFAFVLPSITALQISPAAKSVTLADGRGEPTAIAYTLRVINDERARLAVNLSAEGDLAGSILLAPSSFTFSPDQAEQPVTVTVTPPQDPSSLVPGDHLQTIRVSALPAGSGGQFGSGVTLLHNLVLLKPYDGAYLAGSLSAGETGGSVAFTLSLSNKGNASTTASGTVSVNGPGGLSGSAALASSVIPRLSGGKLTGSWTPGTLTPAALASGHYTANATFTYDDPVRGTVTDSSSSSFLVGRPVVRLAAISPTLSAGAINRVFLPEELTWDAPVDAYADVTLLDNSGATVASTRTSTATLSPSSPSAFLAFLELPIVTAGNYTLRATVHDAQGSVLGNAEWTVPVRAATPLAAAKRAAASPAGVTVLVLLLLVLLLALVLLLWRRRRRSG